MSYLIRPCTSYLQPTCPNILSPREGPSSHWAITCEWMSGLLLPSINIFQLVVSCFESPQQLGWKLETFYNIWEQLPNHFPTYTCMELHSRAVCCGKPACSAHLGLGHGGHPHQPGWPVLGPAWSAGVANGVKCSLFLCADLTLDHHQ